MKAFYFDVGGVLIPDHFRPENALNVFRELATRHRIDADASHAAYTKLQPSLDLGTASLSDLCLAMSIEQQSFEHDWLAMHPLDPEVIDLMERLLEHGHRVGLATNFCRRLLNLLVQNSSVLSRLGICCSSDIGVGKPSREFFDHAAGLVQTRDVVFVDDRAINVEAAHRFGWTAIHATDGWLEAFRNTYLAESCRA